MQKIMPISLLVGFCYTLGWFWAVFLGIHGHSVLAVAGVVFLLVLQLRWIRATDVAAYIQDVILVFISVPLGFFLEMLLQSTQCILYSHTSLFPPIWIVGLYPLFALAFTHSLRHIHAYSFACFMVGFVGAPLSYLAGISLGAKLTLMHPIWLALCILGFFWGLFLCLLAKFVHALHTAAHATVEDYQATQRLDLLYDGACPICSREICLLQKKSKNPWIHYIDISSKEFLEFGYRGVDYKTAMTQIHAIDDKGHVFAGIHVFAVLYARCGCLIASTLLRIPWIRKMLQPLYRIFAKNRLWISGRLR